MPQNNFKRDGSYLDHSDWIQKQKSNHKSH